MQLEYKDMLLEIEDIVWENNGIGHYEYWGAKGFDAGKDIISDFNITQIWIAGKEIIDEEFKYLLDILVDDNDLIVRMEDVISNSNPCHHCHRGPRCASCEV